jgi:hypothetical protein
MNDEFDCELTRDQWETLKILRTSASERPKVNHFTVESLLAVGLVAIPNDVPVITPRGRKVLVRGSPQLLRDLAA